LTITIRDEGLPLPHSLVIHMGAGAIDTVVNAAVRNYGDYRHVAADGLGVFAVSVFAVTDGVSQSMILDALPQRQFARSTVGLVAGAGFEILATSIEDSDLAPTVAAIQTAHYDIVLPAFDDARLSVLDPLDDEDLEEIARLHLNSHAERLLTLFGPREHK